MDHKKIPSFPESPKIRNAHLAQYHADVHKRRMALFEKYKLSNFGKEVCIELHDVRRPLVLVRGKPISREQVMQLVVGEEPLFGKGSDNEDPRFDPRSLGFGVLQDIFYRHPCSQLSTWVYTDGTIGGNLLHLGKYPELEDFLPMYADLAEKYPFLDIVVSYTLLDESCCGSCNVVYHFSPLCKPKDCIPSFG